jgi:hypothetical protein
MTSSNNLKQIGLAIHNCHDSQGKLPTCHGCFPTGNLADWTASKYTPSAFGTQQYFLLPYIEQDNVYKTTTGNSYNSGAVIKTYFAQSDPSPVSDSKTWGNRGATSYASNWHAFGGGWGEDWQIGGKARIPATFPDGTSQSIGYMERYAICGDSSKATGQYYVEHIWGEDGQNCNIIGQAHNQNIFFMPAYWGASGSSSGNGQDPPAADYPYDKTLFTSKYILLPQFRPSLVQCETHRVQGLSAGGILVLLMDGSVRNVGSGVSQATWWRAIVPNDGQVLGNDW